jgi:hypothetical protein
MIIPVIPKNLYLLIFSFNIQDENIAMKIYVRELIGYISDNFWVLRSQMKNIVEKMYKEIPRMMRQFLMISMIPRILNLIWKDAAPFFRNNEPIAPTIEDRTMIVMII